MTRDGQKQTPENSLKRQVRDYFGKKTLPAATRERFKQHLTEATASPMQARRNPWLPLQRLPAWAQSVVSAALAASVTFLLVSPSADEPLDPIAELTQLPGPKVYPPDFDLEGDSKAMNEIVYELFADKNFFVSDLPPQVLDDYKPNEGRFFSWDGEPAVSIQMKQNPKANALSKKNPDSATLLIVKLSEKSQRKFPKEKQTRKVANKAGKVRKVKVWREGNFGYAMVQDFNPLNDTP